ncbi:60S ribosomal protein L23a-like isoform X1 [Canis lupus familiaris]|nr:60S ribosomal protein L23a-like isoform X1 [Canis lupus familiaris]
MLTKAICIHFYSNSMNWSCDSHFTKREKWYSPLCSRATQDHHLKRVGASLKMMLKVKKEAPAPPKMEAKTKTLKAKKVVLKGRGSHRHAHKKICISPTFPRPKTLPL